MVFGTFVRCLKVALPETFAGFLEFIAGNAYHPRVTVHRVGKRRPGRPLLGTEPLSSRLTVMVTAKMLAAIEATSGGHVADFVRKSLAKSLGVSRNGAKRRPASWRRRVRRFDEK